ncbi:MAG: tetratricopeptide repeat protein [Bacteroidales bacterium]
MTKNILLSPNQEERIRNKIKKIKAALAADKKRWGGFHHDGQGLRYALPRLYISLGDFSGGLRYFSWFNKNFPDDRGYPDFLFEWTVILFKTGRLKEAEKKAFQTFTRNTYLFDKFFERPINKIDKWEGSNLEVAEFATDYFDYSYKQANLSDFAKWLDKLTQTKKFIALTSKYIEIHKRLKNEHDFETRGFLGKQANQLENEI